MKTFPQLIEDFLDYEKNKNYSINTIEAYQRDLSDFQEYLVRFFENYQIDVFALTKKDIENFMIELSQKNLTNRTIERKTIAVKEFFKFLFITDQIPKNPAKWIKTPKYQKKLPNFFSIDEMNELLDLPTQTTKFGIRNQAMLELLYSSGLRISELINIKLYDLDLSQGILKVFGKGSKERLVPITDMAISSIKSYLSIRNNFIPQDAQVLFLSKSGLPLKRSESSVIVKNYINQVAKSSGYSAHTIRHTFATHLLSNGADIRAIQEMLGHASITSTEIYTHVSMEEIKEVYHRVHPRSHRGDINKNDKLPPSKT